MIRRAPKKLKAGPETEDLAIRFVNTVAWRLREPAEERLGSPAALLGWLGATGVESARCLASIAEVWRQRPSDGIVFYETAVRLRESIYDILSSRIARKKPSALALDYFSSFICRRRSGLRLKWEAGALVWRMNLNQADAFEILEPIALSAADLMTGPRADKVRQCQDDRGCGWLFVDESRLQNRRWCSMGDCGNRAKARRHYERVRGRSASAVSA